MKQVCCRAGTVPNFRAIRLATRCRFGIGGRPSPANINNKAAKIYAGALQSGQHVTHAISGQAYILVSEGSMCIGGIDAVRGDGVTVQDKSAIVLEATGDSEVLIIDVAA